MNTDRILKGLFQVIAEEARKNAGFKSRIESMLAQELGLNLDDNRASSDLKRRGGRRSTALVDPLELASESEDFLKQRLEQLSIDQLYDVVAQYGMDPNKLVLKWKDRNRVIEHISNLAMARLTKGNAFRQE